LYSREPEEKVVIILTQDVNNGSVDLIKKAILAHTKYPVYVMALEKTQIDTEEKCILYQDLPFLQRRIPFSSIACVLKRTWGPQRTPALQKCRTLEEAGVKIVNGCNLIQWTHNKILQYLRYKESNLIPKSICFDADWMKYKKVDDIPAIISKAEETLVYPMVFKTAQGCKADGVFRADNRAALIALLTDRFNAPPNVKIANIRDGFLLQKYIPPIETSDAVSTYYRINIVDHKPQSAVQFQLAWVNNLNQPYHTLSENLDADDKPVNLSIFPEETLQKIIQTAPGHLGVIGIDVMRIKKDEEKSEKKKDKEKCEIVLLEFNDGPGTLVIDDLGRKISRDSPDRAAAVLCEEFAPETAKYCEAFALSPSLSPSQRSFSPIRARL
jgi:glutathione synthase/RimK-type ligase-like ATP-grasp enzyme